MFEELNIARKDSNGTEFSVIAAGKCVLILTHCKEKPPSKELGDEFDPGSVG